MAVAVPGVVGSTAAVAGRIEAGSANGGVPLGPIHRGGDGSAIRASGALAAQATGVYHDGATLYCSDCHTMHASARHNVAGGNGAEGNISSFPWSTSPAAFLLKFEDSVDPCLSCHDGVAMIPDVVGVDANGLSERSAGHFDAVGVADPRGHTLGRGLEQG